MARIEMVDVGGSPMEVFLFEPPGEGIAPALVLCMHIPGHAGIEGDEFTLRAAERCAEAGYVVAVPFIFHWWPKSETRDVNGAEFRDDRTILNLENTADLLQAHERVDPERIGIVGHCWGGRLSWLGAATDPRYGACVVFYGGRIPRKMADQAGPAVDRAGDILCVVAGSSATRTKTQFPKTWLPTRPRWKPPG